MSDNPFIKILLVEDNELDRRLIERELKKSRLSMVIESCETREQFVKQLQAFQPDIVLCDFSLPQFNALGALDILKRISPSTPLIVVTGTLTDETAVECLKKGSHRLSS